MKFSQMELNAAQRLGESILRFIYAWEFGAQRRMLGKDPYEGPVVLNNTVPVPAKTSREAQTPKPPRRVDEQSLQIVTEVAEILAISRSKVYGLMETGTLPYVRFGRSRRVRLSDVRKLIADNVVSRN